ncbi:hypothetical protein BST_2583 [Bacillus stercoris]
MTEKIKQLNHVESKSSASENKAFFEAFFNYSDIDKRYETIKKHTIEKGFDYGFPSRSDKKPKRWRIYWDYSVISDFYKTMS